jgi:hypothetical protein
VIRDKFTLIEKALAIFFGGVFLYAVIMSIFGTIEYKQWMSEKQALMYEGLTQEDIDYILSNWREDDPVEVNGVDIVYPKWRELPLVSFNRMMSRKTVRLWTGEVLDMTDRRSCHIANIYFENRNRSEQSRLLTYWSAEHRIGFYHTRTLCDVVMKATVVSGTGLIEVNSGHYSWTADRKTIAVIGRTEEDRKAYYEIVRLVDSQLPLKETRDPLLAMATHYHTTKADPSWKPKLKLLGMIDDNLVYHGI